MARKVCTYCGSTWQPKMDHVIAKIKGGVATVPACKKCNSSKGDKPLMQWLRWIKKKDKYRWNKIRNHNYGRKNAIALKIQKVRDEK